MWIHHDSKKSLLKFRRKIGASRLYLFTKRILSFVLPACIIGGVGVLLMNLNLFYIQNIEVESLGDESLKYVTSNDVQLELVDYIGQRLFKVNLDEVQHQIRNEFAFVSQVYVTKKFPNSLVVRIVERQPAIIINSPGEVPSGDALDSEVPNDKYIVGTKGVVLDDCVHRDSLCSNLPECNICSSSEDIIIGQIPLILELDSVLQIVSGIKDMGLIAKTNSIPKSHVIVVELDDATQIIFSTKSDIDEQLDIFEYTRENLLLQGKTYKEIDLRFERPIVRVDKYTDWMTE
ncbi:MAG: FtsQ-type POTRA domain-containing protein [Patescibacteria group bacterium]|nr:FtsQ-type POTRA domain-containing protein [Patescibacteria group bacterium]